MMSLPFLSAIALVAYFLLRPLFTAIRSPLKSLPGPWHSRFTNLVLKYHIVTGRRLYYIDALHHQYGPIVRIAPGEVAVNDVEAFARIHKIGPQGFLKSAFYDLLTHHTEPGIFDMRDPRDHAARRRLFARPFSNSSLQANWEPDIRKKVALAISRIRQEALGGTADVLKWWTLLATDVIAHLSFGESFHMLEEGKQTPYLDAVQSAIVSGVILSEMPLLRHIGPFIPSKSLQAMLKADDVVFDYGALAVRNMKNASANTQNLFGQMLAQADSQEKTNLKDSTVRQEAANLIVAGSDTTAVTLTYLVWAVLKQPHLQSALEEEVAGLSDALDGEELKQAPLLNSVIEEALRLYGAAPGSLPRVVPDEGVTFCGHFIPGGTEVSTQAYTMHRDENTFPEPLVFDGWRFIDSSKVTADQKTALSPFGAGSRVCLGIHLAWMELRLGIAMFFRECRGAKLGPCMTDEMMEIHNQFLISPKGHCCEVTLL